MASIPIGFTIRHELRLCKVQSWQGHTAYIEPDAFLLQDVFNIGKTVFLTKEETEKALQEMDGRP